jgi:undecaprenyl-diphosphatase
MLEKIIELDKKIFLNLNSHHSDFMDNVMWFISGKLEWIPLYLLLIALIIHRFKWKSIPIFVIILAGIVAADQIAVHGFKEVFERPRPSHNPDLAQNIHLVKGYTGGMFGFVSNHAANSFCLATITSLIYRNKFLTIGMFVWAGLVSYSRIYLGVHYPADIVGGVILGFFVGVLFYFLLVKFLNSKMCDRMFIKEKRL